MEHYYILNKCKEVAHYAEVASHFPEGSDAYIVALLHDTIEDELFESVHIFKAFPLHIYTAVLELTRKKESYKEYIKRVSESSKLARQVKHADLTVNLARPGMPSLKKRYREALKVITNSLFI